MSVIPAVLLNALREYSFIGSPLWRMSDGKDLVRIELTFHKNLPTQRLYKKGVVSRKQPAPSAGEWPCQPAPAHLPTTKRPTPAHWPTPCVEKETPPQPAENLPDTTRSIITHDRTQKTVIIETAPTTVRPQIPPPTPDSPPKKRTRTKSPTALDSKEKCPTSYVSYDFSYPLNEYDLQGVTMIKLKGIDVMIVKGQRLQRRDETINIDRSTSHLYAPSQLHTKERDLD